MQFFIRLSSYIHLEYQRKEEKKDSKYIHDEIEQQKKSEPQPAGILAVTNKEKERSSRRWRWKKMKIWSWTTQLERRRILNSTHCADRDARQQQSRRSLEAGNIIFLDLRMNKPFEFILMVFISVNLLSLIYIFFPLLRLFLWYSSLRHSLLRRCCSALLLRKST